MKNLLKFKNIFKTSSKEKDDWKWKIEIEQLWKRDLLSNLNNGFDNSVEISNSKKIYLEWHSHFNPLDVDGVEELVMWWFAKDFENDSEQYIESIESLISKYMDYCEEKSNVVESCKSFIVDHNIKNFIIEATESDILETKESLSVIEKIVDIVWKKEDKKYKEKIKKDIMLIYWWPYMYMLYKWFVWKNCKVIPWENQKLINEDMESIHKMEKIKNDIIEIAKKSADSSKITPNQFIIVRDEISEYIRNNDFLWLIQNKNVIMKNIEHNEVIKHLVWDWISLVIKFLENSAERDKYLLTLVTMVDWNVLVSYWRSHIPWIKKGIDNWLVEELKF